MTTGKWLPTFRRTVLSLFLDINSVQKFRRVLVSPYLVASLLDFHDEGTALLRNVGNFVSVETACLSRILIF